MATPMHRNRELWPCPPSSDTSAAERGKSVLTGLSAIATHRQTHTLLDGRLTHRHTDEKTQSSKLKTLIPSLSLSLTLFHSFALSLSLTDQGNTSFLPDSSSTSASLIPTSILLFLSLSLYTFRYIALALSVPRLSLHWCTYLFSSTTFDLLFIVVFLSIFEVVFFFVVFFKSFYK